MPQLAGALTRLGLLALPAVPSPTYLAALARTDTWSLQITDSSSLAISVATAVADGWSLTFGVESASAVIQASVAASDTWSASVADSSALTTYPHELTQLSLLALPGKYGAISAKAAAALPNVNASDTWLLTWTETPVDLIDAQVSDTWRLAFATEQSALAISQTYAANDAWALTWADVGSVFAGGPILQVVTDTWSLQFTEASSVAATVDASDTWSLQFTDAGSVFVSSDEKLGTDAWSLAFALETAFFAPVVDIPIIASDEWRIDFADSSGVLKLTFDVPRGRVIHVTGPSRTKRV